MECYLAVKRNEILIQDNHRINKKYYAKLNNPETKDHILCDFICMKCLE